MMKKEALSLLLSIFLFSCASKDFKEPGVISGTRDSAEHHFKGSYGDVWKAAVAAAQVRKYAIASSSRDSGRIVTDWVVGKSDRLYSGYGETRIPYNIRFKLSIQIKPSRSGVHVSVVNQEEYYTDAVTAGTDFSGSLYQWVPTASSGAKEQNFIAEIEKQLVPPDPKGK